MKKYIPSIIVALAIGSIGLAVTLTDIPNPMSFGNQAKQIINDNNAAIEAALDGSSPLLGTDLTVTGNSTVGDSTNDVLIAKMRTLVTAAQNTNGFQKGQLYVSNSVVMMWPL